MPSVVLLIISLLWLIIRERREEQEESLHPSMENQPQSELIHLLYICDGYVVLQFGKNILFIQIIWFIIGGIL